MPHPRKLSKKAKGAVLLGLPRDFDIEDDDAGDDGADHDKRDATSVAVPPKVPQKQDSMDDFVYIQNEGVRDVKPTQGVKRSKVSDEPQNLAGVPKKNKVENLLKYIQQLSIPWLQMKSQDPSSLVDAGDVKPSKLYSLSSWLSDFVTKKLATETLPFGPYPDTQITLRGVTNGMVANKLVTCPAKNAFADYYVQKFIGRGSNGTVWLACSQKNSKVCDRVVRVSFGNDPIQRQIEKFAGTIGIGPEVFEYAFCNAVGDPRRVQLMSMSRLDVTLEDYLINTPRQDWDDQLDIELLKLFQKTARARIVHHDCKPDNIMLELDPTNRLKVKRVFMIDFEMAYFSTVHSEYSITTSEKYAFDGWPRVIPAKFVEYWDCYCLVFYMESYTTFRKMKKDKANYSFRPAFPELFRVYDDLNSKNLTLRDKIFKATQQQQKPTFIDINV